MNDRDVCHVFYQFQIKSLKKFCLTCSLNLGTLVTNYYKITLEKSGFHQNQYVDFTHALCELVLLIYCVALVTCYRQSFHAEIDTDNLTEAFNHTLRSQYLQLRQDTSVTDLCEVLLNIVFPEQQKEYTIAVTQQTEGYRKPWYEIPGYLIDCPRNVQSACFANISKAKQFASSDITTDGNGVFTLKSTDKSYLVDIPGGCCECSYFIKTKIPCKHLFAIFALFCDQWSWYDLPCQLTDSTYMTLETSLLEQTLVDTATPIVQVQKIFTRNDDGNTEDQQSDAAFKLETDTLDGDCGVVLDDCLEFEKRMKIGEKSDSSTTATAQHIPTAQTSAHRVRILQKNAHTILTKCKDVCYLTDDCSVLESVIQSAENIYRELVESADSSNVSNSLPIFPVLSQTSASNSKKQTKLLCRQIKPVKQRVSSKKEVKEPSNPLSKDQSFNGNLLPPVSTADTKANTDIYIMLRWIAQKVVIRWISIPEVHLQTLTRVEHVWG